MTSVLLMGAVDIYIEHTLRLKMRGRMGRLKGSKVGVERIKVRGGD